jgi:hypothetical protein
MGESPGPAEPGSWSSGKPGSPREHSVCCQSGPAEPADHRPGAKPCVGVRLGLDDSAPLQTSFRSWTQQRPRTGTAIPQSLTVLYRRVVRYPKPGRGLLVERVLSGAPSARVRRVLALQRVVLYFGAPALLAGGGIEHRGIPGLKAERRFTSWPARSTGWCPTRDLSRRRCGRSRALIA